VAIGIATLAPVHNATYAAMHIGHFGSSTSIAPELTHPLALRHHPRRALCSVSPWQQFIARSSALSRMI